MKRSVKRIVISVATVAGALLVAYAFRPKPMEVEAAPAVIGPMQVSIDEDGETRAIDRFTLSAPIAGRLSRISLREGDDVGPQSVIATISPLPLEARELAAIRAAVQAAEARKREAEEQVVRWQAEYEQAERDSRRMLKLAEKEEVAQQQAEQAETKRLSTARELGAARFRVQSAAADIEREKAGLVSVETQQNQAGKAVSIRAPTRCRILRILEKGERVVPFGTPIVLLSNPKRIEVVVDLLSADAVKVKAGAAVSIENWGGTAPLRARVRTVEPYGFTKVSALGIEEQRVNVVADFIDSPAGLGDGYRVDARIVLWESPDVLKVPASALFRSGANWAVFVVEGGRASLHTIEVGHRSALEAEITNGLEEGARVVLHPSNELGDNARVVTRGN